MCDCAQAFRIHRCASDFIYWNLSSRGDCIDHHARERALAQFADQQAHQKMLFCLGRAREQLAQRFSATRCRAAAANACDLGQSLIDL